MSLADEFISAAPGTVSEYAGISLPAGYLWANGAAVSRSTYARLFAAITLSLTGTTTSGGASVSAVSQDITALATSLVGAPISGPGIPAGTTISAATSTTITLSQNATASASGVALVIAPFGVGDGSATFNLPDRRGRVAAGHDKMGAASAAGRMTSGGGGVSGTLLGAAGGAETHTLTTAEMPAHTHANTLTDGGHTHSGSYQPAGGSTGSSGTGGAAIFWTDTSTSIPTATTGITITNASQGSGGAHTIMQPSIVMNHIIKT
jgi:microcystin-dependent protein